MNAVKQLTLSIFLLFSIYAPAQESPVYALDKINEALGNFNAKYLAYQSAVAHGSKLRKCEKKRQEMLTQLENSRYAIIEVPYYKGDKSLHQSSIAYLKLVSDVLNENYQKIVNLEDIAEQSYDAMEAYILLRRKVDEKMEEAARQKHEKVLEYCLKQNITLTTDNADEDGNKMKKVSDVMDYYNKVYLAFFKCQVQESNFMDAMAKKNVIAMEQSKSAITKYALESLDSMKILKSFNGDAALKLACKNSLEFFKKEAASSAALTDYFLKEEDFEKIKKNFERNSKAQEDQAEIDKYNKAIDVLNKSLASFNETNQTLNKGRQETYKNWNAAVTSYMDTHVPYAK
jgi:hypothetical protein